MRVNTFPQTVPTTVRTYFCFDLTSHFYSAAVFKEQKPLSIPNLYVCLMVVYIFEEIIENTVLLAVEKR